MVREPWTVLVASAIYTAGVSIEGALSGPPTSRCPPSAEVLFKYRQLKVVRHEHWCSGGGAKSRRPSRSSTGATGSTSTLTRWQRLRETRRWPRCVLTRCRNKASPRPRSVASAAAARLIDRRDYNQSAASPVIISTGFPASWRRCATYVGVAIERQCGHDETVGLPTEEVLFKCVRVAKHTAHSFNIRCIPII